VCLHQLLEPFDEATQVVLVELEVAAYALAALGLVDGPLETLDPEHGLAEHLQQPPVGVPGEPLAAGLLGQALDALVIQPDVEHGVHHPGHRELGAGPDADEQRGGGVTEALAHLLLERREVFVDLG
jgi:hypothetical protein